jgi:hypothetical protein
MATNRPFAYNPTAAPIAGATQFGNLAYGHPDGGFAATGLPWWGGADEEPGYVIAYPVAGNNHPRKPYTNKLFLDPVYKAADITLSNSDQTAAQVFSYTQTVLGVTPITSGVKYMFTALYTSSSPTVGVGGRYIGIGEHAMNITGPFDGYPGNDTKSVGFSDDGRFVLNGSTLQSGLPTWGHGDIIDIAVFNDVSGGVIKLWIRVNGGDWDNDPSHNPATNVGGMGWYTGGTNYPALCPAIYGTMRITQETRWSVPTGFTYLGKETAEVGFIRTSTLDEADFINTVNSLYNAYAETPREAKDYLTANGLWTNFPVPVLALDAATYEGGTFWYDTVPLSTTQFDLHGPPQWEHDFGGYFSFTAAHLDYAETTSSLPSLPEFTVEVWHRWSGVNTGSQACIISEKYTGGSINYFLGNPQGILTGGYFNGGFQTTSPTTITPNVWYHIVLTVNVNNFIKLYINGDLVETGQATGSKPQTSGSGINLMSRWDNEPGSLWGGDLAIVNIYDGVVPPSQVLVNFNDTKARFGY